MMQQQPLVFPPRMEAAIERAVERMLAAYESENVRFTDEHKPTQIILRETYETAVDMGMETGDPDAGIAWFIQECMANYGYTEEQATEAWDKQVSLAMARNRRQ